MFLRPIVFIPAIVALLLAAYLLVLRPSGEEAGSQPTGKRDAKPGQTSPLDDVIKQSSKKPFVSVSQKVNNQKSSILLIDNKNKTLNVQAANKTLVNVSTDKTNYAFSPTDKGCFTAFKRTGKQSADYLGDLIRAYGAGAETKYTVGKDGTIVAKGPVSTATIKVKDNVIQSSTVKAGAITTSMTYSYPNSLKLVTKPKVC